MLVFVFMSFIRMQSYLCCFCVYLVLAKLDLFDSTSPLHCFKNRNCQQFLLIKQKQSLVVMLWQQRKLQFCKNQLCFTHLTCMLCMQRMGRLISLCFISLLEIVLCKCPFSLNEWMEEFYENINNIMSLKINFKSREMTLD